LTYVENTECTEHLTESEKMHPARFSRPKSTFLTIPILVAGTNSVSSGNIVEESFFDKYFARRLIQEQDIETIPRESNKIKN
jgi:hypothetical protein